MPHSLNANTHTCIMAFTSFPCPGTSCVYVFWGPPYSVPIMFLRNKSRHVLKLRFNFAAFPCGVSYSGLDHQPSQHWQPDPTSGENLPWLLLPKRVKK